MAAAPKAAARGRGRVPRRQRHTPLIRSMAAAPSACTLGSGWLVGRRVRTVGVAVPDK